MNVYDAVAQACSEVGIHPPKAHAYGKWLKTDTLAGKNGKGDGRVIINDGYVTAWNWQTGIKATVGLRDGLSAKEQAVVSQNVARAKEKAKRDADRAAQMAGRIVAAARPSVHPYLAAKGFRDERALVIGADDVRQIGGYVNRDGEFVPGNYLVAGKHAIVMPARIGARITSVQLIWEDGTKKFLFGGEISGSCHRIAKGGDTWLCEGYATGCSLRAALKSLNRSDTILCCFSASNVAAVARSVNGRCFIATDNDKPLEQFGWLGTGEHWARVAGKPYVMPPELGDINDMHMSAGIFAVQRMLSDFLRIARLHSTTPARYSA